MWPELTANFQRVPAFLINFCYVYTPPVCARASATSKLLLKRRRIPGWAPGVIGVLSGDMSGERPESESAMESALHSLEACLEGEPDAPRPMLPNCSL